MSYTEILQVGATPLTIIVVAFLTFWLALRRFHREKWWEAKMQAYTDVIQALHHIKRDLDISINAEVEGRETDTDYHKDWENRHRTAWDEIRRQVDVGEFLYSPVSMKILLELVESGQSVPDESYVEHLLRLQAATLKCLPAIKAAARADLGLPKIG